MRPFDGEIASGVIDTVARLVTRVMLLIHQNERELHKASENGKPRSHQHPRPSLVNREPIRGPFLQSEFGMQRHHGFFGKPRPHPFLKLRRKVDFRHQKQYLRFRIAFQRRLHGGQIHLGFSGSRHTEQQKRRKPLSARNRRHGLRLLRIKNRRHGRRYRLDFEFPHPGHRRFMPCFGNPSPKRGQRRQSRLTPKSEIVVRGKLGELKPLFGKRPRIPQKFYHRTDFFCFYRRSRQKLRHYADHLTALQRDDHPIPRGKSHVFRNFIVQRRQR